MGKRKLTEEDVKKMVESYATGSTTTELGAEFGVNASQVGRVLAQVGVQLRPAGFRSGVHHYKWNGGRSTTSGGYVLRLVHPEDPFFCMATKKTGSHSYVLEHRYVMAQHVGRPLRDDETVHHRDGNKANNRTENLELRVGRHGRGAALCCADCGSRNIVPVGISAGEN
jgi:hypothetical protein